VPHTVQFVDSIATSPTVRLNLNDQTIWRTLNGTEFPPPPIRRALAQTLMADGARIPASAYDNRTLHLQLQLQPTTTADQQATQIQALARELNRPANFLMWKAEGATNPVFFRTLRSDISSVVEILPTLREATVDVLAEPFAYGTKQTLSPVTVANNPASANGCFWDVTGVIGDVETPVVLRMAADKVYDATKRQSLFAVRRRGTPSSMPFLVQAEACTQGTNTTTQANDATYSGAGNNFSRCTFGTATNSLRLTIPAPTDDANLRGTYKLYARIKKSVSGDPVLVQAKWNGAVYTNDQVTLPASTLFRFVDLTPAPQFISMPAAPDPVYDGYSGVEQVVSGRTVEIWAARTSGTTNLDFDFLLYVPVDDAFCLVKWTSVNDATYEAILDGVNEAAYILDAGDAIENVGPNELAGPGFPMLTPNQTNRIVFIRDVGSTSGASDAITNTTDITLSYWPRYLYIRPSAT
jgi:hypothetical protein